MVDDRIAKLVRILVDYSVKIEKKNLVQVNFDLEARELVEELYREILKKGAYAKLNVILPGSQKDFYSIASEDQLKYLPKLYVYEQKLVDAVITVRSDNHRELSRISPGKISRWQKTLQPVNEIRFKRNNWVLCGYPGLAGAKDAKMSFEDFKDFVFSATNIDWTEMSKKQDLLKRAIDKGRMVRIIGKDTDVVFSIKGNKGIKCDGRNNMPDGEVFTSPKRDSVNGKVSFTFPTVYQGTEVDGVVLEFKDGKVVNASASRNEKFLKQLLATDEGASYLGEFGVGMNYNIKRFIRNTLFDEKIGGTIHLALGQAYKESGGKNKSAIHWDMVTKPEKVFIDDKIILKDGEFMF